VKIITVKSYGKTKYAVKRTVEYDAWVTNVTPDTLQSNGQRVAAIAVGLLPVGGGDEVPYGDVEPVTT
jgi:hypothetical protein